MSITLEVLWKETDAIAIALSGGIDSMVLYHLLTTRYHNTYKSLTIFHVNHGVREVSEKEEKILKVLATKQGHMFLSTKLNIEKFTQQKGRNARYAFFNKMMDLHSIDYCLTAHHQDDNVETVLHELLTHRYLYGVGIKKQQGKYLRPMMNVKKHEIYEYKKMHELIYLPDASNDEDTYTRNYLRQHVIPAINQHNHLQLSSLLHFREDFNTMILVIEREARDFIGTNITHNRKTFNKLNHMVKVYVISNLFRDYVERTYIEECIRVLESSVAQSTLTSKNCTLNISYNTFFVDELTNVTETLTTHLEISEPGKYIFNGYEIHVFQLNEPLLVRTRKPGDRILIPNVGTKQLRRLFIDEKIPNKERNKMPIIIKSDGQIIAVGSVYNIIKSVNEMQWNINLEIRECTHDA